MAVETQYTARTGLCTISTANSSLVGSGTLGTVIQANPLGSILKTIIVKAQTNTSQGMVRLFIFRGELKILLHEIMVPIVSKSPRDRSFHVVLPFNYQMQDGDVLMASTQNADTFNVIAEVLDWNYGSTVRVESTHYEANTGLGIVSTANPNLDGSGAIESILTARGGYNGCEITSIHIKGIEKSSAGMIRLYIKDAGESDPVLFCEVIVPLFDQNGINTTFSHEVIVQGSLSLQPDYQIMASTEQGQQFHIAIEASDWNYPT